MSSHTYNPNTSKAVIIGAGPAGLTAAYELLKRGKHSVVILEATEKIGGISCTVNYKGNRIDMGGHRFFSKSETVMRWWADMLPIAEESSKETTINYQGKSALLPDFLPRTTPDTHDCLLVRSRRSRIYFLKSFFDYPLRMSIKTFKNLGFFRVFASGFTYLIARLMPRKPEVTLEDFLINRFGHTLYNLFFKSYTQKVWGRPCSAISADWGAQRIKGLSISKALLDALRRPFERNGGLMQKQKETSLIESFLYPKFGPGQMWEKCLERVVSMGGQIIQKARVQELIQDGEQIQAVVYTDSDGIEKQIQGDVFFSTMPIKDLVSGIRPQPEERLQQIARDLPYRSFMTVGLLVKKLKVHEEEGPKNIRIKDNWIYIQDPTVTLGRLQIFNNWSPWMVSDNTNTVWLGLEYFCDEGDDLWNTSDSGLIQLGINELEQIGILDPVDFLEGTVCRVPKAYPAYFGSYKQFPELQNWLDRLENLFLIGRNGMHRYNNQDHSMLSAMHAVRIACGDSEDRAGLWKINAEADYHEEKS